jgi:Ser/Thr protein kinase RdoA (MazF antagonist)
VLVHTSRGKKVLKLHRSRHQIPAIVHGHSILTRLDQLGFPTTRPVTTPDDETLVSYAGGNYALYDFVDGINYASNFLLRRHRLALMRAAGRTQARLHRRLEGFMPAGRHHLGFTSYTGGWRRDLAWFAGKVGEMKSGSRNLGNDEDQVHADWLIRNCDSILAELARSDEALRGAPLPRVVIHGDYGLHNLIFRRDGTATPLDFESARVEWRLSDLVSGLSRLRYGGGSYDFESIGCFMAAYQEEYPLSADEWRLFPQVWRFYKLRSALIYWNSYLETGGPARKLISARDAVRQADWALNHPDMFVELKARASIL